MPSKKVDDAVIQAAVEVEKKVTETKPSPKIEYVTKAQYDNLIEVMSDIWRGKNPRWELL